MADQGARAGDEAGRDFVKAVCYDLSDPAEMISRAFALPKDGDAMCIPWEDLVFAAQVAALAYEYAKKVERGEANDIDTGSLSAHLYTLANDLHHWTTEVPDDDL